MRVKPRPNMESTATPDAGDVLLGYGTDIEPVMEMGFWVPQRGMGPKDNPDAGDARPNMESTTTPMEAMPRQTWNHDQIGHENGVLGAPLGHGTEGQPGCG